MFTALLGVSLFRPRTPRTVHLAAAPSPVPPAVASSVAPVVSVVPVIPSASAPEPSASIAASVSASAAASAAAPVKKLDRTLRVAGLGWDVLSPGLIISDDTFTAAGLDVAFSPLDDLPALESALARGGVDPHGADIAILPLPSFVASYERLRALEPRVFLVVGWSRGREVFSSEKASLTALPSTGNVTLAATAGSPAAYLGLTLLDLAGLPASRIQLLPDDNASEASFVAVDRASSLRPSAPSIVTSADIPRLIPIVAIAQAGLLREDALRAFVQAWLGGETQLLANTAGAARTIGAMPGAPEPLGLINRLGTIAWASLADNARMASLSGQGAVNTNTLFRHAWRLHRDAHILTTPPPESPITDSNIIASIVRASPPIDDVPVAIKAVPPADTAPLLIVLAAVGKLDDEAFIANLGWVAGLFDRSTLRVTVRGASGFDATKTRRIVETARDRFGLAGARVSEGKKLVGTGAGSIEVLPAR